MKRRSPSPPKRASGYLIATELRNPRWPTRCKSRTGARRCWTGLPTRWSYKKKVAAACHCRYKCLPESTNKGKGLNYKHHRDVVGTGTVSPFLCPGVSVAVLFTPVSCKLDLADPSLIMLCSAGEPARHRAVAATAVGD